MRLTGKPKEQIAQLCALIPQNKPLKVTVAQFPVDSAVCIACQLATIEKIKAAKGVVPKRIIGDKETTPPSVMLSFDNGSVYHFVIVLDEIDVMLLVGGVALKTPSATITLQEK